MFFHVASPRGVKYFTNLVPPRSMEYLGLKRSYLLAAGVLAMFSSCLSPVGPEFNTGVASLAPVEAGFFQSEILPKADGKVECHAASIAERPDGTLLAAWYAYSQHGNELDGSAIYTSLRGKDDWGIAELFRDSPQGDGNPVLYAEGWNMWLFSAVVPGGWSTSHIEFQMTSEDGTWQAPFILDGTFGSNVKSPPIRLMGGELLLPAYDDLMSRSIFYASKDGTTWDRRSVLATGIASDNIQPAIVQLDNGDILAVMRDAGGRSLWVSKSSDAGYSWSKPSQTGIPNPASAVSFIKLSSGHLLLVYNNATERVRMSVSVSPDGGASWTPPRIIEEAESSYPFAIQTSDGMIHIVYTTADRQSIAHVWFNESWAVGG